MSVVFIVIPAVAVSWPVLCSAIAGAAGVLGYRALNAAREAAAEASTANKVEIEIAGAEVVAEAMKRDSIFSVGKDDIVATFRREADGRCTVHVEGVNRSDEELDTIGRELAGRVIQQYAYNKVMTELKNRGFTVTQENVQADQTIQIQVAKYV
jgi:hypothetical protein